MKNVFTVFVSPEETFKRVRESKLTWLYALIAIVVLSAAVIFIQSSMLDKEIMRSLQSQQIDTSLQETVMATAKTTAYVMAIIVPVILAFITGLLLMLLNLVVRGEGKYMQFVSVAALSAMPGVVGSIIASVVARAAGAQSMTDVSLSLGAFIADKSSALYHWLSIINPFSLWSLFLYVVGASVMMKRPRKTVGTWIVIAWLLLSVVSILML